MVYYDDENDRGFGFCEECGAALTRRDYSPCECKALAAGGEAMSNIKNLPEGTYWTETGWSQSYPWVEVKRSASGKSVTLARVLVKPDPEWKKIMKYHPGGFAGHCSNQSQQTWLFDMIHEDDQIVIRDTKRGWKRAHSSSRFREGVAFSFYDYNF